MNYLSDPDDLTYSVQEMWEDKPTIQIWDDYITIDGVTYTDIWLSNEAAKKFKVNAYDFQTAYSIASNSNGTFAQGTGTLNGIPFFDVNNEAVTQYKTQSNGAVPTTATIPDNSYGVTEYRQSPWMYKYYLWGDIDDVPKVREVAGSNAQQEWSTFLKYDSINQRIEQHGVQSGVDKGWYHYWPSTHYDDTDFDFDWVSGTIPTETILPPDTGMMMRIPSNYARDLKHFLVDNPEFGQPGGTEIDVDVDPDIMTKLDDLIDIIAPIIPIIRAGDIQFTINHSEPTPVPDVPIIDATVPQAVQPIINEIQNQGDIISQSIPPIIESIPKIDEICNNIDTAPYHDLDTGIDRLPSFFLPFITDLRSALGIWHYVTEWLAQINTTFAFVTGCLVGTSIMTPVYAAIAGFMCIKIYRRMTA